MDYTILNELLPKELVIYIGYYDNGPKQNMNRVIKELHDFREKVREYEAYEKMLYYLDEWEESNRKKYGLSIDSMEDPILVKFEKLNHHIHNMISLYLLTNNAKNKYQIHCVFSGTKTRITFIQYILIFKDKVQLKYHH